LVGRPRRQRVAALGWFDFSDFPAPVRLLRTAPLRAEYSLKLPPGWRDDPAVDAATEAGLTPLVERYRWTPDYGPLEWPSRLEFRQKPDDTAIFELFRRVNTGPPRRTRPAHRRGVGARRLRAGAVGPPVDTESARVVAAGPHTRR
jgi:hypothetical protein